jgi:acyl carrier protein
MSRYADIHAKVVRVVAESLAVDEESITPASTLQEDLGAESIDFLDIIFRLEREFDIHIPRGELFPESMFQGDPEWVQEGRVTDDGMKRLRSLIPFADLKEFSKEPRLAAVPTLFTIDLVVRYIDWKLNCGEAGQATRCKTAEARNSRAGYPARHESDGDHNNLSLVQQTNRGN